MGAGRAYQASKRAFDAVAAAAALVVLAPFIGAVAALVRWRLGRPVIFTQERPGRDGAIFRLRKFRTMVAPDPARGLISDEQRLTRFGAALRAWSLDELPTLWNVLRGDMSLVGPRPLLVEYLKHYTPRQARRHEVRPGVTGLAQVNGRNQVPWPLRLEMDVKYVERQSWMLDLRILLRTVGMVLRRSGISAEGHATMPEYRPEAMDA
ncbi:MAG: sugar transferase [Bifidobacteriaceae bacterium]|jgi:lipopolysaccharide/colanic/teichoic acid biosynthesis glycosyltransferase|nr:sugar transferase [Bifidobacteriaceae bacterium]